MAKFRDVLSSDESTFSVTCGCSVHVYSQQSCDPFDPNYIASTVSFMLHLLNGIVFYYDVGDLKCCQKMKP